MKTVTEKEFWQFWGIILAASVYGIGGENLWDGDSLEGLLNAPNMKRFMKLYRFNEIKRFQPKMFEDETRRETDPWWRFIKAIEDFNANRSKTVAASAWKVFDESMSAFRPQTSKTGGLPNISFVERKPENLGTEFKNVACGIIGMLLNLQVCRGANNEVPLEFDDLNVTSAYTARLGKESARCGQTEPVVDIMQGDSWFSSIPSLKAIESLGHRYKGIVKTAHKGFPKEFIEETMAFFPGGSHMVMKTESGGKAMYAIGYKYSSKKTLCFIASEGTGSTLPGKSYEARYPDRHGNVHVREVPRPRIVSTYFDKSNAIDSHNHVRQFELALEKFWVTQNPWFRLSTTLFGMGVVDCWKAYRYHLNQKHKQKQIPIRSFASLLARELLHNSFCNDREEDDNKTLPASLPGDREAEVSHHLTPPGPAIDLNIEQSASNGSISSLSSASVGQHRLGKYEEFVKKDGGKRTMRNRCRVCLRNGKTSFSRFYCIDCGVCFCADGTGKKGQLVRMCWSEHLKCKWAGNIDVPTQES